MLISTALFTLNYIYKCTDVFVFKNILQSKLVWRLTNLTHSVMDARKQVWNDMVRILMGTLKKRCTKRVKVMRFQMRMLLHVYCHFRHGNGKKEFDSTVFSCEPIISHLWNG